MGSDILTTVATPLAEFWSRDDPHHAQPHHRGQAVNSRDDLAFIGVLMLASFGVGVLAIKALQRWRT